MAYDIYTCSGFVLDSYDTSDTNKTIQLFTKDFGIISVKVIGIDKPFSKRRALVNRFTYGDFDIVHGTYGYRLTNGIAKKTIYSRSNYDVYMFLVRASNLVISFLPYKVKDENIFEVYKIFYEYVQNYILTKSEFEVLYVLFLYQILMILGYVEDTGQLILPEPDQLLVTNISEVKKTCTSAISSNSLEFVI